jgi:hypothetical protein
LKGGAGTHADDKSANSSRLGSVSGEDGVTQQAQELHSWDPEGTLTAFPDKQKAQWPATPVAAHFASTTASMSVADAASPGARNMKTGVEYRHKYDVIVAHMKDTFPKVDTSSKLDADAERGRKALERLHRRNLANTRLTLYKPYYSQHGGGNSIACEGFERRRGSDTGKI